MTNRPDNRHDRTAVMAHYMNCIDPTDFRTVKRYLDNPRSAIEYVLHVKNLDLLPELAARLDEAMKSAEEGAVHEVLTPLFQEDSLRISARQPLHLPFPEAEVATSRVPLNAECQAIYLEPFYLTHTDGLFEGKLRGHDKTEHASAAEAPSTAEESTKSRSQQKTHDHDDGLSH